MGLAKKTDTAVAEAPKAESGTQAAMERLKAGSPLRESGSQSTKNQYKQRDYEAEAKGKVKCAMFESALQSPALAGLPFNTIEEFLKIVEKAADAGVEYTWR